MDPSNPCDTQNFEKAFLDMKPVIGDEIDEDEVQEQGREDIDFAASEDPIAIPSPRISHLPEGTVGDCDGHIRTNQPSIDIVGVKGVHGADKEVGESGSETTPKMPEGGSAKQAILKTRLMGLLKSSPLTQRTLGSSEREPHPSTRILNSLPLPMLPCL